MPHKFDPNHLEILQDPERVKWQDPVAILRAFDLRPGESVADVGAGPGFFSVPAAKMVGEGGRIYAVDMQEPMLWALQARLLEEGLSNVLPVLSLETLIPLPSSSVDLLLLVNTLHELEEDHTLAEAHRLLRPAGRMGLVDWKKEPMEHGPPVEHRLSLAEAQSRLERNGFAGKEVEVGPYHYGLRLARVEKA